jgi:hypothetical protein
VDGERTSVIRIQCEDGDVGVRGLRRYRTLGVNVVCWAAVRTIPVTSEGQGDSGPSGKEDDRARGVSERVASERMERAGCLGLGGWPREVRSSHIRNVTAAKDVDVGVTQPFRQYICHKRPRP